MFIRFFPIFLLLAACVCTLSGPGAAHGQTLPESIQKILRQPDDRLDLLQLKIAIDQFVDPSADPRETTKKVEAMVASIRAMLPPGATSMQTLQAIRKYLYEKGPWNDHQAFQYDFDDPKGTNLKSKMLSRYIATRKGNCISMPILFIVIADRLGLDVSGSMAPEHYFVKFTDTETGRTYNVETTSGGGFSRDGWYQEQMHVTDEAIRSGIYLRKLSRKENAVEMLSLLGELYFNRREFDQAIETFKAILHHHPRSVYSMLKIGGSYAKLFNMRFAGRYRADHEVPVSERPALKLYVTENRRYFAMAESLGWREPTASSKEAYSRKINDAKKNSINMGPDK